MEDTKPNLRYIKLVSGEEVIGHVVCEDDTTIEMDNPKRILTQYFPGDDDGSIFGSYALVSFMKGSSDSLINMAKAHIVCNVTPDDYMMEDWIAITAAEQDEHKTELSDDPETETKTDSTNVISFGRKPIRT